MIKEEKFIINPQSGESVDIKKDDFKLVQQDTKIHDLKFETKATTFFKDAMKRFAKSKPAVVGFAIVAFLMLTAFILPSIMPNNGAYSVDRESVGGDVTERFIQPKLFDAGFGFWDGTLKRQHIMYDIDNETPVGYSKETIMNMKTYEETSDVANVYGRGGYVNVYSGESNFVGNYYSTIIPFDFNENYTLSANFIDEEILGYVRGEYRVLLEDINKERYLLTGSEGNDGYINDLKLNLDLNKTLTDKGYEFMNNSLNAKIYFEIKPTANTKQNIVFENLTISSTSTNLEEKERLANISFGEGNEALLRESSSVGFWNTTSGKKPYKVNYTFADFTYDQYADIYGEKDKTYVPRDLLQLDTQKSLKINFPDRLKVYPATSDQSVLKERFQVLNESCPIEEVLEQVGDATYNPITKRWEGFELKTRSIGYKLLGYESMPRFFFGTNNFRKDYVKLIFTGLRFSLFLALGVSAVNILFGLFWGSISGYFGGWTDIFMERFSEILSGLPGTVIITLVILYGAEWQWGTNADVLALMISLFLTGWMGVAARTRTQFYRFKGREYVLASRTLGAKDTRLIFRHILPNSAGTIITGSILMIPSVIYTEASIAYLKLGLQGQVMFGVILSEANSYYKGDQTYLLIVPTLIMALLLVSFNLFGNGLRDAFNPSLKGSN